MITSPTEGTTDVIVYAPGIYDWSKHKVFATKQWYDVGWEMPPEATNRIGMPHVFTTKVMKYSDKTPLPGYLVEYKVLSGPAAILEPGGGQVASVKTDTSGAASATLKQQAPKAGTNEVEVKIIRPEDKQCCKPAAVIHIGKTRKNWVAPAIAIQKTAPARALLGEQFNYGITVSNPSQVGANNVVVTDDLPAGIQYVASNPEAKVAGQKLSWSLGTMAGGESRPLSVTVKATKTGTFVNSVTATADNSAPATAEAKTLVHVPILAITKTGPDMRYLGRPIEYQITVTNKGDAVAKDTVVIDTLPANAHFLSASDGGQVRGGKVTWSLGDLAPNASKSVGLKLKATQKGEVVNNVVAKAYCADATAKATTLVQGIAAILLECVDSEDPIEVGTNETYTITVTNQGQEDDNNIVIVCTLPAEMDFVSATGPTKETVTGKVVTFAPTALAPGKRAVYRVIVKGIGEGDVRFKVSMMSAMIQPPPAEETESTNIYK